MVSGVRFHILVVYYKILSIYVDEFYENNIYYIKSNIYNIFINKTTDDAHCF